MGRREDVKIAPRCDFIYVHEEVVNQVLEVMPTDEELQSLADFFRIFGDSTRIRILYALSQSELCVCDIGNGAVRDFPSASDFKADAAGKIPPGGKKRAVLFGGRTYRNDPRAGDGAYRRIRIKL